MLKLSWTKHPVLLPRYHPLTTLVVREAHEHVHHNGVKKTLTETRKKFWIPKGRSLVHYCTLCRRFERASSMVCHHYLYLFSVWRFSYTGVDFAGPLTICIDHVTILQKVWICLFTCLVTQAVHLDVVIDMSTTYSFLRCLKRSKRPTPQVFIWQQEDSLELHLGCVHLAGLVCAWRFNVERAPWCLWDTHTSTSWPLEAGKDSTTAWGLWWSLQSCCHEND